MENQSIDHEKDTDQHKATELAYEQMQEIRRDHYVRAITRLKQFEQGSGLSTYEGNIKSTVHFENGMIYEIQGKMSDAEKREIDATWHTIQIYEAAQKAELDNDYRDEFDDLYSEADIDAEPSKEEANDLER
jgi:hypothetical protein